MKKQQVISGNGFKILLLFLLLYIVGAPFLEPYRSLAILAHASLSMVLFAALYALTRRQNQRFIAIVLLCPLLSLYWLGIYDIFTFSKVGIYFLFTVYYGLLIYSFVLQIRNARQVSSNVLFATFCLYLIIGLFWGVLYALLHEIYPEAYSGALLLSDKDPIHIFNYFSFITLTTLGYGDITPQTTGAASVCQMEAIVGQFFTAVVVAWLVGMHVSSRHDSRLLDKKE
jgi:hypothetical protein